MHNICYYSSAAQYGGAEIYIETLVSGCMNSGLDCVVIVNAENSRFINKLESKKIPYFIFKKNTYNPSMYINLFKLFKQINPELLHINLPGPWNGHLIATLGKVSGIKNIVTTEHLPMFGPSFRHSVFKLLDTFFVNKTITVSYENVKYLEGIHKIKSEKIEVVHNGIDVDQYVVNSDHTGQNELRNMHGFGETDLVLGIVGRLTEQKGHKYAILAMAEIIKSNPNVKMAILGDGELMQECTDLVDSLNISSQVKFLGFQANMYEAYSMLDILLMPSIFEALPLTLIEAMATGLPVIATSVNGIPEVVDNDINGLLIKSKDVDAIINSIKELESDRDRLKLFGVNARKKIEECFSLKKMVKDTVSVYEKLKTNEYSKKSK